VTRVVAVIFHHERLADAGPLSAVLATVRASNARRHAAGFASAGAEVSIVDGLGGAETIGEAIRRAAGAVGRGGLIVLGSGAAPLATAADHRELVRVAGGPSGRAVANSRFSADVIAIAGADRLAALPDVRSDNGIPRWLADEAGFRVADLRGRWRLQVDIDSPLDAFLVAPAATAALLTRAGVSSEAVGAALAAVAAVSGDRTAELVVAGRSSAGGLAWLERRTASRTRALIEERGFRTRPDGQRPVRSILGLLLDRDGPAAFGDRLMELGDAAVVDTRVLLAHRLGSYERRWPTAEDRFASDLLLAERIADPWLGALTASARDAAIPIVLGGHSLVGPGLRLALRSAARSARGRRTWT
jgi:hypothetical protein